VDGRYLEPGGSWLSFWLLAAVLTLGCVAAGCLSARRIWTVRVTGRGAEATLAVGREQLRLADVDADHVRAVGTAGADAGAPVLGGGWSLPEGRTGLPLRRTDGTTVLVPTRAPARLTEAILTAHPAGDVHTAGPGRVEP
jgi:hypothetical protein